MSSLRLLLSVSIAALLAMHAYGQPARRPPPAEEEVAKAKKLIADVYRSEYTKAVSPEAKLTLSVKLLNDARNTRDDPAGKYALLLVSRDIAASAGDWEAAFKPIAQLSADFAVETFVLTDEVRPKIEAADKPPRDPKATFRALMNMTESAVKKDRYDIAGRLTTSAQGIARDGKDQLTTKQLSEYSLDLQRRRSQYEALQAEFATLESMPLDRTANLAIGRFRGLEQNRWQDAIPLLALGSDPELAKLAGQELTAATPAERLAIADSWWSLAETRRADTKGLRRHAVDCYLRARPTQEGLARKKAEARLEEFEKWHSRDATYTVSAVNGDDDRRYPPLPSLLNQTEKFHNVDSEFAFHINDRDAHIVIDLKKEVAVSRLHIHNRRSAGNRARHMGVYLSHSPGSRGEQIWQAPDGAAEWNVPLDRLHVGRYLTIARDPNSGEDAILHLRKVKVFGPE
jgi:hypothetical protein